jgi:biotin synthase
MYEQITEEIINGRRLTREDDVSFLLDGDLTELKQCADRIRKELCGNRVNLCTIINGRSGGCSENCKFCAQSAHHNTSTQRYSFLDVAEIVSECRKNEKNGVHKFSIVTAGRSLSPDDFDLAVKAYQTMHEECQEISLCASHGFLTEEQLRELKESGVTMYHENIETSRRFFPFICTTHTYDEKIACIKAAQRAGLEVCSGGILGMGETWEDRLDMAFSLAELKIDSIPLNALMPIPGTPLAQQKELTEEEILRCIVLFRFLNPTADIRLAAGRSLMKENGREAFFSGANATITGDMLTTSGNNTEQDRQMLLENGFDISR